MSYHRAGKSVGESSRSQSTIASTNTHSAMTARRTATHLGPTGHKVIFKSESSNNSDSAITDGADEDTDSEARSTTLPRQSSDVSMNTVDPHPIDVAIAIKDSVIVNRDGVVLPFTTAVRDFAVVERLSIHEWVACNQRTRIITSNSKQLNLDLIVEMENIYNSTSSKVTTWQRILALLSAAEAHDASRPKTRKLSPHDAAEVARIRNFYSIFANGRRLIAELRDGPPHKDDLALLSHAYDTFERLYLQWTPLFRVVDAGTAVDEVKMAPPPPALVSPLASPRVVASGNNLGFMKTVRGVPKALKKGMDKVKGVSKNVVEMGKDFGGYLEVGMDIGKRLVLGKKDKGKGRARD